MPDQQLVSLRHLHCGFEQCSVLNLCSHTEPYEHQLGPCTYPDIELHKRPSCKCRLQLNARPCLQDELWIIDVSQAVDLDHPRALDFLKEDAAHINAFFRRAGIAVLTTRQLFDFAVDPSINESNLHEAVETLQQLAVRCSCIPCILKAVSPGILASRACGTCCICTRSQLFFSSCYDTQHASVYGQASASVSPK